MNHLLPKHSYIKIFLPYAKNYNCNLSQNININYTKYDDTFKIDNSKFRIIINMNNNF